MKRVLVTALLFALALGALIATSRAFWVDRESTPDQRREAFEIVWRTVKEKHFDPTLGGLDWDKIKRDYAPRADAAKTDSELYEVLQQMLGELHQSHFNIIPPELIIEDDTKEPAGGGVGLDLRVVDGLAMITRVDPNSTGARAGLRPGFIVTRVDDSPVDQLIARFAKSKDSQAITRFRINRSILGRINGAPKSSVRLSYLDGEDKAREATIERERLPGEMSQRMGNFPPQYAELEVKRLAGGAGYIRFNIFVMLLSDRIKAAIRSLHDAPGIIFDIRGNPGGLGAIAPGIVGELETREVSLGTMKMRRGELKFVAFPQKNPYAGPVAVLIDGMSASTSEVLAGGLQEAKRAIVVGERSAGAVLPSLFEKLPTGALFQYAIGDYRTPSGVLVEGLGVKPDVEAKVNRATLLAGRDPQLDEAVRQLSKAAPAVGSRTVRN